MVTRFTDSYHMSIVDTEAKRTRRGSFSSLTVELRLATLERFLRETLPLYCMDREVLTQLETYADLSAIHTSRSLTKSELSDLSGFLSTALDSTPDMPSSLVSYVHSTMGLLNHAQGELKHGIDAFKKALWIEVARKAPVTHMIGLTLHRLGICFAQLGDHREAVADFKRALYLYQIAGLASEHSCILNVQKELLKLRSVPSMQSIRDSGARRSFMSPRQRSMHRRRSM